MGVMFPFLQSPGTSPDSHDFFKYDGEWLSNHISHLFQNPGMDIIWPHGLIHVQFHEEDSDLFHRYSVTETRSAGGRMAIKVLAAARLPPRYRKVVLASL